MTRLVHTNPHRVGTLAWARAEVARIATEHDSVVTGPGAQAVREVLRRIPRPVFAENDPVIVTGGRVHGSAVFHREEHDPDGRPNGIALVAGTGKGDRTFHTALITLSPRPVYTEVEPAGPVDHAQPGGDAQLSTAWGRRFVWPVPDHQIDDPADGGYAVVTVECYVVNTNPNGDPERPVLTRVVSYSRCLDPADVGGTERYATDTTTDHPEVRDPTGEDAHRLCAAFDPATLDWDGEPR